MDGSLDSSLLSATESRVQPRTETAFLPSLFSVILSRSALPGAQQTSAYRRADATKESEKVLSRGSAHSKGPQPPQEVEASLVLLIQGVDVMSPVYY